MDEIKIIEIGSSSILDDMKSKSWVKLINNHSPKWGIPKYWKECNELTDKYDIVFISMGSKVKDTDSTLDFLKEPSKSCIWQSCVINPSWCLNEILPKLNDKSLIIYLDSISALTDVPYPTSVEYSIAKVAMSTYLKNIPYIYTNTKVLDIHIGSTKSRMCNHGMDREEVFDQIMSITSESWIYDYHELNKYNSYTIDNENQIKELLWNSK